MRCECYFRWPFWNFNEGCFCPTHGKWPIVFIRTADLLYFSLSFRIGRRGMWVKAFRSSGEWPKLRSRLYKVSRVPPDVDVFVFECSKCHKFGDTLLLPSHEISDDVKSKLESMVVCHECAFGKNKKS